MADLPSAKNLFSLLQRCRQQKNLAPTFRLHTYLCELHLETHSVVGIYLLAMLVDCGSLPDAHCVFDSLGHRENAYPWNCLISGYTRSGQSLRAFSLYDQMRDELVQPNAHTFMAILPACTRLQDVVRGQGLRAEISSMGMERDPFVGSALVHMFAKCGCLAEAQEVFDQLSARNMVSWTALITAYTENGLGAEALDYFDRMQLECIPPDVVTYICCLKACSSIGALGRGQVFYAEIIKKGLEAYNNLGSTMVGMLGKCGLLVDAHQLFDKLPVQDAISWNALIVGYAEHGLGKGALDCLAKMELQGYFPDVVTFVCCLKASDNIGSPERSLLCSEIIKKGLERGLPIGSALVSMYGKCGLLTEAQIMLKKMPIRDTVAWSSLIAGYAEQGLGDMALGFFQEMRLEGIIANVATYVCSLKACSSIRALQRGQEIHTEIAKVKLEEELNVSNTLIDMYAKCGSLLEAHEVVQKLKGRDAISWAALISGYAEQGLDEEVLKCLEQMQDDNLTANIVTYVLCLKACGTCGAIELGRGLHAKVKKLGWERDPFVSNTLVDMYNNCGLLAEGREVFDKLHVRDAISWNAMIKGYGENHEGNLALQCFDDMQRQGVKPDAITFICLLIACSHASLVLKGEEYYKGMTEKHGIEPTLYHFSCMVDLYARSGRVLEAERFVEIIQCPPKETLTALLSACKIYGKVEAGSRCFQQLVQLNYVDAFSYSLMADIYANAGKGNNELRKQENAKKKPAHCIHRGKSISLMKSFEFNQERYHT